MLAALVFSLALASVRAQSKPNLRGVELGIPDRWEVDDLKNAQCEISGTFPAFLDGYFLCQTSAAYGRDFNPPGQRLNNIIDGLGAVASFDIGGGGRRVTLSGAYYPSRYFKIWDFFGKDFRKSTVAWVTTFSLFNKTSADMWKSIPEDPDILEFSPNVDFWKIGRDIVGGTENYRVGYKFDVPTLSNFEKYPFIETNDIFRGTSPIIPLNMPIHERMDNNGVLWASVSAFNPVESHFYQVIFSVSPSGVRTVEGMYDFGKYDMNLCDSNERYMGDKSALAGYMHSVTSTERYLILPITSSVINPCKAFRPGPDAQAPIQEGSFPRFMEFDPEVPLRFLVFDTQSKRFLTRKPIEAFPAMWISHQFNAYDESSGQIVMDMLAFEHGMAYEDYLNTDNMKRRIIPEETRLMRFTLDLTRARVKYDRLLPDEKVSAEFPQINHRYDGEKYQYGYVVLYPYAAGSQILKIDMQDSSGRNNKIFNPGSNFVLSEPWFVERPGSRSEDDGILLVRALDTVARQTVLFAVNPQDMRQVGLARCPSAVPFGLHNKFFSKAELGINPALLNNTIFPPPRIPTVPNPLRPPPFPQTIQRPGGFGPNPNENQPFNPNLNRPNTFSSNSIQQPSNRPSTGFPSILPNFPQPPPFPPGNKGDNSWFLGNRGNNQQGNNRPNSIGSTVGNSISSSFGNRGPIDNNRFGNRGPVDNNRFGNRGPNENQNSISSLGNSNPNGNVNSVPPYGNRAPNGNPNSFSGNRRPDENANPFSINPINRPPPRNVNNNENGVNIGEIYSQGREVFCGLFESVLSNIGVKFCDTSNNV